MREVSPDRDLQASEELSDGELSSLSETEVPSLKPRRWRQLPGSPSDEMESPSVASSEPRTPPLVPIGGSQRRTASHINDLPPEIVGEIFKMIEPDDRHAFMLVQRRWLEIALGGVWMRPLINTNRTLVTVSMLLAAHGPSAHRLSSGVGVLNYARFVRRLILSSVADHVSDAVLLPFAECTNLERLALNGCTEASEETICQLISSNKQLHSVDLLGTRVGDNVAKAIAKSCPELTTLSIGGNVTDVGMTELFEKCPTLKRLRLAECPLVSRVSLNKIGEHCTNMTELDLSGLKADDPADHLNNDDIVLLLPHLKSLRDLKLDNNPNISRYAFEPLVSERIKLETLRLLSLALCPRLTDSAVEAITKFAPRLRHLALTKCSNITDRSLHCLADNYGANLNYLHLGHCSNITDAGIAIIAQKCTRLVFVDAANCVNLTNASVRELAKLQKLRRIGLVKCAQIDDGGILALTERPQSENMLERIHLSYCLDVTVPAITRLLNACPKLNHLSLTGVHSFLSNDLMKFCREAPPDLSNHQQRVFCVYSGQGVRDLRDYLNARMLEDERIRRLGARMSTRFNGSLPTLPGLAAPLGGRFIPIGRLDGLEDDDDDEFDEDYDELVPNQLRFDDMIMRAMFHREHVQTMRNQADNEPLGAEEGLDSPILIDGRAVLFGPRDPEDPETIATYTQLSEQLALPGRIAHPYNERATEVVEGATEAGEPNEPSLPEHEGSLQ